MRRQAHSLNLVKILDRWLVPFTLQGSGMSALVGDGGPPKMPAAVGGAGSDLTCTTGHQTESDGYSNTKGSTGSNSSAALSVQETAAMTAQRGNFSSSSCTVVRDQEACQSPKSTDSGTSKVSWQPSSPPAIPTTSRHIDVKHTAGAMMGQGGEGGNAISKAVAAPPTPAPFLSGNADDLLNDVSTDLEAAMGRIAAVQNAKLNHLRLSGLTPQASLSTSAAQSDDGKTV